MYRSKGSAEWTRRRMNSCQLNVWRCPYCRGWHLGNSHNPFRQQQRIDQLLGIER